MYRVGGLATPPVIDPLEPCLVQRPSVRLLRAPTRWHRSTEVLLELFPLLKLENNCDRLLWKTNATEDVTPQNGRIDCA